MPTQIYFIPAIGATIGIVGSIYASRPLIADHSSIRNPILVTLLGSFALGCIAQAPNPVDEWKRVLGMADSLPWASDPLRSIPSEWSPDLIDFLRPQAVIEVRNQIEDSSVGYFGYMGNSIQLATGINNLTRINSGEVLIYKGSERLRDLACREVDEKYPRYIIHTEIDLLCRGYRVATQFKTTAGIQVLERIGK